MTATAVAPLAPQDLEQIERANATDRMPVVFVHGLWFLASSWDRWDRLSFLRNTRDA